MAYTIEQLSHAIRQKAGNITEAAGALGITRWALQKRIAKSADLQQLVKDEREALVDMAESAIRHKIRDGDTASIIFTLKTLGKERGYTERNEVTGPDGAPLEVIVKGYVNVSPDAWDKSKNDG